MNVTKENFANVVKILNSRSAGFKTVLEGAVRFGFEQATLNGNSSPLMTIREGMPNWVKPSGCTVKRLDDFVKEYCGFEWNRESKSYKKLPGANLRELPEQGVKFWDYATEKERAPYSIQDDVKRLILKAKRAGGITKLALTEMCLNEIAASDLPDHEELASTLGL